MKVIFKGSEDKLTSNLLAPNTNYEAEDSIYDGYYDLKEVEGFRFRKDLFRGIERRFKNAN